ncbi:cGMP-specific 3',5'-cyclic phosphodiesterase-like isoform X2 [Stylophora pistillata]|uniref:cGMP-specific 3',5'-cyclic phosphodiesterase-like isoform X2 n=1 Tax=Stylophora pistillata TaxID=50429 RepID=UPI000C03B736|nr:cGMP-specific 3',5'-cyclic phosphodiesterase-like isoform X2 [Stylophora pistillata]
MASDKPLSNELVEKYLDDHQDFAKSYFERKATSSMVDNWMSSRSHRPGSRAMQVNHLQRDLIKPQLILKADGDFKNDKLNSIFGPARDERKRSAPRRKSSFRDLDEKELFMELIRDIANELDINMLSHKILVNVSILTNADRCSLFLVRGSRGNKVLVSKLFDVTSESTVEDSIRSEDDEICVPLGVGIAGHTAATGETININDAYSDPRFNSEVDKTTGYRTHSILCMPIKSHDGEVIGVAQIINKKSGEHHFTQKDEEVFRNYLTFCGIGITNAQLFEISVQEYNRNQILLQLARGVFEEQSNLDTCVHNIMVEVQQLLDVERCMVFLMDEACETQETIFSKVFDLHPGAADDTVPKTSKTHWSMNNSIASLVASSGKALNIPDAYADSQFNPEGDIESGFKTKSILCMPIFDRQQKIVGVAQLLNKNSGKPFSEGDENLFEAFAIFCGLGIHNALMYEQACKLLAKQCVAMEVLSYHASAQQSEVDKILGQEIPSADDFKLYTFEFSDFELTDDETILASIRLMQELDFMNAVHTKQLTLCRWLLSVKKNYRAVIYHNWRHAFNVAQSMFTMITTGNMKRFFTDLEVFALVIACYCHDLDHRGTNNAFQTKTESPLAQLYGTSTMEHHHFDHCIMILNSEGNNIFEELSPDDYRTTIKVLEHAILSTDLALYFQKRGTFEQIVHSDSSDWTTPPNREILRAMMMTACDVAAITKPWEVQQQVAELVASEFFEQGDMERFQLNSEPIPMMDRKKKDELPKMQVGFIDFICIPVYKLFYDLEPCLKPLYDGCINNKNNWLALADKNTQEVEDSTKTSPKEDNSEANANQKDLAAEKNDEIATPERKVSQKKYSTSEGKVRNKDKKSKTCNIL